jgi:acyl-coenzyme A thioesterase PaaI-like protein
VPGVGVAEAVDVSVKKNLVRAHAVALKDGSKIVVVRVEALVATVGVDRSSSGRKSVMRAGGAAG